MCSRTNIVLRQIDVNSQQIGSTSLYNYKLRNSLALVIKKSLPSKEDNLLSLMINALCFTSFRYGCYLHVENGNV